MKNICYYEHTLNATLIVFCKVDFILKGVINKVDNSD